MKTLRGVMVGIGILILLVILFAPMRKFSILFDANSGRWVKRTTIAGLTVRELKFDGILGALYLECIGEYPEPDWNEYLGETKSVLGFQMSFADHPYPPDVLGSRMSHDYINRESGTSINFSQYDLTELIPSRLTKEAQVEMLSRSLNMVKTTDHTVHGLYLCDDYLHAVLDVIAINWDSEELLGVENLPGVDEILAKGRW